MKNLKYISIFLAFIVFYTGVYSKPLLLKKLNFFKSHIKDMFYVKKDKNLSYKDILIKRIRYLGDKEFEIITYDRDLISLTLSYKVLKENKNSILLFLNESNKPYIVVKKQINDNTFVGDIHANLNNKNISLKEYLTQQNGVFYAK